MPYDPSFGLDSDLAYIGVTGGIVVADIPATPPLSTDWLAAWAVAEYTTIGYLGPDGLNSPRGEERQEFTPWQSASPIRTQVTTTTKTFSFEAWESNFQVVSLYYQVDAADMTAGSALNAGVIRFDEQARPAPQRRAFGIDVVDGDFHHRRFLPNAEITTRGDVVNQTASIIRYPLTITAYPGADGVAVRHWMRAGWSIPA